MSSYIGHSLLRIVRPVPELTDEDDLTILDIQHSEIKLPDDDTTYWCSVHKLPEDFTEKHHSVQVKLLNLLRIIFAKCLDRFLFLAFYDYYSNACF